MTILVDMDDTIDQLLKAWVRGVNERYGRDVRTEDVREWDVSAAYEGLSRAQVYEIPMARGFWQSVEPVPGAAEGLKRLMDAGHEIYLVTATPWASAEEKLGQWLQRYFPFLTEDRVILTSRKQMIRGDVLIDDGVHNLEGGAYEKLLMDAPHNRDYDAEGNGMTRVHSWAEIEAAIWRMEHGDEAAGPDPADRAAAETAPDADLQAVIFDDTGRAGATVLQQIPVMRMRERLDADMGRKDYASAARHLRYWLQEARAGRDRRGEFEVRNEMMGFFRKTGDREQAMESAEAALELIPLLELEDTVSGATAHVNAGTVLSRFEQPQKAVEHFEAALPVYERDLAPDDERLGGLYNNMALALADLGRYEEAFRCYGLALDIMGKQPGGQLEQAITWLNMANAAEACEGMEQAEEKILEWVQNAEDLMTDPAVPRDGYYAFVCDKCIPTFEYYGWFSTAAELRSAADRIYSGN